MPARHPSPFLGFVGSLLRPIRRTLAAVVAVAVVALARPAVAQGTSDLFPDPIASRDAEAMLSRVGLEGESRIAALKEFERYVERFLELRKTDIDAYLRGRSSPGAAPTREEVAARVDDRSKLLKRIAAIENQYFDALSSTVDEAHRPDVERERARAERRRAWAAANPYFGRGSAVELADLVDAAVAGVREGALPADVIDAVNGLLSNHEMQQTALHRKLLDLAVEEPLRLHDARVASGATRPGGDPESAGPEAWSAYFKAMADVRRTARAPQAEVRAKLRELARSTMKSIVAVLPEEFGAKFRANFVTAVYPQIAGQRDPIPPLVTEARGLAEKGEITKEELATIESLAAAHAQRRNAIDDRMMDHGDTNMPLDDGPQFTFGPSDAPGSNDAAAKLAAMFEERSALDAATRNAIAGAAAALASKAKPAEESGDFAILNGVPVNLSELESGASFVIMGTADGDGEGGAMLAISGALDPGDPMGVPSAMKRPEFDAIIARFGLSEDLSAIATMLFDDYTDKHRELEAGDVAELAAQPPVNGMIAFADGTSPPPATKETVARQFELRRTILDRVLELDREFFASLEAALGGAIPAKSIERLRNARERAALDAGAHAGFSVLNLTSMLGGSKASSVDLAEVVRGASDELALGDGAKDLEPILDAWEEASIAAFRRRWELRLTAQRMRAEFDLRPMEPVPGEEGAFRVAGDDADFEKLEKADRSSAEADRFTATINRNALEDLLRALPDDGRRRVLRDRWNRAAWPEAFRDPRDVSPRIEQALAMPELPADAKAALEAIRAEHAEALRRITDEIIATNEKFTETPKDSDEPSFDIRSLQQQQDVVKRLGFERSELNERTLRRIREALPPELAAKIADLPKARGIQFGGAPAAGAANEERSVLRRRTNE
jgi:hypothetical protein